MPIEMMNIEFYYYLQLSALTHHFAINNGIYFYYILWSP
jgi:hypothetical protein